MTILTLAGTAYEVSPPPFGKLRKLIASFNRMIKVGLGSDAALDESVVIFALLLDKSEAEIDAMPISILEMTAALNAIPAICGLVKGEKEEGEALVAAETVSTESTAT